MLFGIKSAVNSKFSIAEHEVYQFPRDYKHSKNWREPGLKYGYHRSIKIHEIEPISTHPIPARAIYGYDRKPTKEQIKALE